MMHFFTQMSGWTRLARAYPAPGQPEGQRTERQTVQVGSVRFRRCVTVCVSAEGLYLRARVVLSRYAPILIPWGEIEGIQEAMVYWQRAVRLRAGNPEVGTVTVPMALLESIRPHLRPELFVWTDA